MFLRGGILVDLGLNEFAKCLFSLGERERKRERKRKEREREGGSVCAYVPATTTTTIAKRTHSVNGTCPHQGLVK